MAVSLVDASLDLRRSGKNATLAPPPFLHDAASGRGASVYDGRTAGLRLCADFIDCISTQTLLCDR